VSMAVAENRDHRVLLGVIGAPHGVRGLVRVKSFTAEPEAIAAYGPLEDERGERRFALEPVGAAKGVVIARLPGIVDRDAAERLKGVRLYVRREALPEPGEEEYYHADLLGLAAVLRDGTPLGRVKAVNDFGAGDHLEIESEDGASVMVPFTRAAVPVVDLAAGRVVIDPPAGLFDGRPVELEGAAERDDAAEYDDTGRREAQS
jgi:16S rRNA processing protein RimM